MVDLASLAAHLDELLEAHRFDDYSANGIQVARDQGQLRRLMTTATASLAACRAAAEAEADALLVHHGLIWGKVRRIDGILRPRLAALLSANCGLLAYHLPLDAHPVHGNNAWILERLGIIEREPFGLAGRTPIGLCGVLPSGISVQELSRQCHTLLDHEVLHCPGGPAEIRRVGVITGGGHNFVLDAAHLGLDVLITGETSEQTWHEARESGCHVLACGHYATECHAVHELGSMIATRFDLEHLRFDESNPA